MTNRPISIGLLKRQCSMIMINMITGFLPIRFGTNEEQPVLYVFVVSNISMVLTKHVTYKENEGRTLHSTYVPCQEACPLIRENMGKL
jgi:hypothetical protein